MKRIAITGSSGYLGSSLIRYFAAHEPEVKILGLDIVPPSDPGGHEFLQLDMCRPELATALKIFQPDTVVHMAFIVPPMHDERKMRAINLEGSHNVLEAAAAAGVERLLVTSSATALGARPDNPVPLDDFWPGRAGPEFSYAAHKVELEAMLVQFAHTLEAHRAGILAYYDYPISTGPLEGTNNKIKTLKKQAYGFRDLEFFKLKIMGIHEAKYALVG